MGQDRDTNLALFIDFDNVALGAREARQRFDVNVLLQRILEKGKIIVKKAYADWHYYKEHMSPLHEAAIELIEIPMPRISGKNSADIRLVVDAMDLCYSKDHIDTFVIVSGDSDFSPLVSKLRENNKRVIGIGVKNSSSKLLISNCDEFIFYDDLYGDAVGQVGKAVGGVPTEKREVFDFLLQTASGLLQESRGTLYSSLLKDTMTRKRPDFNERAFGYANFGDLLDDARRLGLLEVERDARAGGTWVVFGLGKGVKGVKDVKDEKARSSRNGGRSRRSRRRSSAQRKESRARAEAEQAAAIESAAKEEAPTAADLPQPKPGKKDVPRPETAADQKPVEPAAENAAAKKPAPRKTSTKKTAKKAAAKKTAKKAVAKKAPAKKAPAKKTAAKRTPAKKAPAKKTTAKKTTRKPAAKKTAKKTAAKKASAKKTPAK